MANNRVGLYCPLCDQKVVLAKCLAGDGYYRTADPEVTEEQTFEAIGAEFLQFMEAHMWCGLGFGTEVELRFENHHYRDREFPLPAVEAQP